MTVVSHAHVRSYTYTSPALLAGDLVVLVVGVDDPSARATTPAGWERAGSLLRQAARILGGDTGVATGSLGVYFRRAKSAGALSASFSAYRSAPDVVSVVMRGPTSIADVRVERMNAQTFTFPSSELSDPMTGHALHVAWAHTDYVAPPTPSGDTALEAERVNLSGVRNGAGQPVVRHLWLAVSQRPVTSATTVPAAATSQRLSGWALTVVAAAVAGPPAPEIISPVAGSLDLAAGFLFEWVPVGVQTGYALRRRSPSIAGNAWRWFTGSDWSATTEVVLDGDEQAIMWGAGWFPNAAFDLEVATRGDALRPELGSYAQVSVVGKANPAAPTLSVSNVSGADLTSFTPTLTMTGSAGSGATFTGYRVELEQAGEVIWSTATPVASPFTLPVAAGLLMANNSPLTIRAAVVQDGTMVGPFTEHTYDLAVPTPAAPVVTVASFPHPVSFAPGWRVMVEADATGLLALTRDGAVVSEAPIAAGVPREFYDWGGPSNVPVTYGASVTTQATIPVTSPVGTAAPVALVGAQDWLIDLAHPQSAVRVDLVADEPVSLETRAQEFAVIGSSDWLYHGGTPSGPRGATTVRTRTREDRDRAVGLLTSGRTLLLRGYVEQDVRNREVVDLRTDRRFHVVGAVSAARLATGPWSWRDISFSWIEAED